jgi:pilus assembly protein CpaE
MPTTPNLLVIGSDPQLHAEVESALASLDDPRPVLHSAPDVRQGLETARSRRPEVVLIEMTTDLRALAALADEMALASPETVVAAAFRPDSFGPEVSEAAVFIEAMRAGVKDFLRRPVSKGELESLLFRVERSSVSRVVQSGTIVSFMSNKGGVGKSTLAVNVGAGLALRHPDHVLLIDASVQMGVCASMLDLHPTASINDAVRQQHRLDETLIRQLATPHHSGLHLLAAPSNAMEGVEMDDEMACRILTLARRAYQYVIVDTFPMLDRINVSVLDLSDRAYLVFENVVPTLQGAVEMLRVLDSLGFPRQRRRIVLNRTMTLAGSLRPDDVVQRLGHNVDHVLPFDKKMIVAANTGDPFVLHAGRFSRCGRQLRELIDDVESVAREEAPREPSSDGQPPAVDDGGKQTSEQETLP